jgi:hypothetical protein
MNIGEERSLGIENGVEMFSKVISHNELHGRFVRLSDNKVIFKSKTINGNTYVEYYDPEFWTIEFNGKEVESIPNFDGPVEMAATLGDRVIRIQTK